MNDRNYKCPVCGAPVEGEKCEYCGCVIYDFAVIDFEHPCYIKLRVPYNGKEYIMTTKVICQTDCSIELQTDQLNYIDFDGRIIKPVIKSKTMDIRLHLTAMTDNNNILFTLVPTDRPYRESWRDDIEDVK